MRSSDLDSQLDDRLIGTTQAAWARWPHIARTLQGHGRLEGRAVEPLRCTTSWDEKELARFISLRPR